MRTGKAAVAAVLIALFSVISFAGCSQGKKDPAAAAGRGPGGGPQGRGGDRTPRVDAAPARIMPLALVKQYIGEIKPYQSVDIRSTASGWLTAVHFDAGDKVAMGDVICAIEHEDIKAQADQARANIAIAKAAVARAGADLERVVLETRRVQTLYEKGYAAHRDLEQAQSSEKQARASVDAARGQLDLANAQLSNIQVKLNDTSVRAPFAGTVSQRFVDPGAYVAPSTPIVMLVDDSRVKAVVNVVEEDFPKLLPGAEADITSDAYPGQSFTGKIIRIPPAIDAVSRTSAVEILIDNSNGRLRTGMTVRVGLVVADNPQALVAPEAALKKDVESGREYVFLLQDGKAVRADVESGIAAGGFVEIVRGLSVGDMVITSNARLSHGMKVKVSGQGGGRR